MSAIITETFRKNNTKAFLADLGDEANQYYVGLGKSDSWAPTGGLTEDDSEYEVASPLGTYADSTEVLNNLTTLVGITGSTYSQVIPNIAAKTNRRHKAYNPYDPDCFYQTSIGGIIQYPCYAIVSNNVYLCLKAADSVDSFTPPNGSSTSRIPFRTVLGDTLDNSVWVYVYTIKPEFPINGVQFVSVPDEPTLNGDDTGDIEDGSGSLVYGFTIQDGGTGYTTPTVEFVSDSGVTTTLTATVTLGVITKVTYTALTLATPALWLKERGYVRITGGGGAGARIYPNIAPAAGFGANPSNDLPSWYAGIAVDAVETIFDDGAYIPYRQVSIIKNPEYEVGVVDPELSLNGLQQLNFGSGAEHLSAVLPGQLVTQATTGAIGIFDYYDSVNKYLYYHQTFETGFVPFDDSEIEIDDEGSTAATPTSITTSEYVKQTGEVIFTENRKKITRVTGQTEEITIILQF